MAETSGQGPAQRVKMNEATQTLPSRSEAWTVRPSRSVRVKSPRGLETSFDVARAGQRAGSEASQAEQGGDEPTGGKTTHENSGRRQRCQARTMSGSNTIIIMAPRMNAGKIMK